MCSSRRTGLASESWQPSYLGLTWVGTTPNRSGWVSLPASATLTLTDLQKVSGSPDWFKGHRPCKESSRLIRVSARKRNNLPGTSMRVFTSEHCLLSFSHLTHTTALKKSRASTRLKNKDDIPLTANRIRLLSLRAVCVLCNTASPREAPY